MHEIANAEQSTQSPFDSIRRFREDGSEFWSARDLMGLLGYQKWQKFQDALERAKACAEAQGELLTGAGNQFEEASCLVSRGNGALPQEAADVHLSRFAAYLVAMNGDPRKPEIAAAQRYFAIRTRQAERAQEVGRQILQEQVQRMDARIDRIEGVMEGMAATMGAMAELFKAQAQQAVGDRNPNPAPAYTDDTDPMPPWGNDLTPAVCWWLRRAARPRVGGGWAITAVEIARGIRLTGNQFAENEIENILEGMGYRQGRFRQAYGRMEWYRVTPRPC